MKKNVFICYRSSNIEIATSFYRYIESRNKNENLGIDKLFYSNNEAEGNYFFQAVDGLNDYNHIIILIDEEFTANFFKEDGSLNEETITAKEILNIGRRLENNEDLHLYSLNVRRNSTNTGLLSQKGREDIKKLFSLNNLSEETYQKFVNLNINPYDLSFNNTMKDASFSVILNKILENSNNYINSLDANKYLEYYYDKKVYNLLPNSKIRNCIYAKSIKFDEDIIDVFKKMYVKKKVYRYDNDNEISNRVFDYKNDVMKNDSLLIGNAGCGKSTLLFHVYIYYTEQLKNKKIIPVFLDLNDVVGENDLINKIHESLRLKLNGNFKVDDIYQQLASEGYKVLLILDSYDECRSLTIETNIKNLRRSNEFVLNNIDIEYKIIVGLRRGAYDTLEISTQKMKKYLIRDFDIADVDAYINKLVDLNKISYEQIPAIQTNIDLMTYTDKINPFLLSMIVHLYVNNFTYIPNDFKIVDILKDGVNALIKDINVDRKNNKKISDNTLKIIGIYGLLDDVNNKIYDTYNFNGLFFEDDFNNDIKHIKYNTYLLNKHNKFYQKIFSDLYGASFILDTINGSYDDKKYLKILNKLIVDTKYNEFYEYVALLSDALNISDYTNSGLDKLLNYLFANGEKNIVFNNLLCMVKGINRYSNKKIIKDSIPITENAIYNEKNILIYLYKKIFGYMLEHNLEFNYGYYYQILSCNNNFNYPLKAIVDLEASDDIKFKMLSIFRDCYVNLNCRNEKLNIFKYQKDIFELADIKYILKKSVNNKTNPLDFNLREALNFCCYSIGGQSYDYFKHVITDERLFPNIYDITNYIPDCNVSFGNSRLITNEDNLFYVNSDENYSYKIFSTLEIKEGNLNVDNNVISIAIYKDQVDEVYSNLNNLDSLASIDIDNSIKNLKAYCFSKCENVRGIHLPESLVELEEFALVHCSSIKNIILPNGVTKIGESAFEDCFSLESITFGNNVTEVGNYLFEQCASLKEINFGRQDFELKDGLFVGCGNIKNFADFNLNKKVKDFPTVCFANCDSLEAIDLTEYDNLEFVGSYCFSKNNALKEVIFPKSLKNIRMAIFYDDNLLDRVVFNSIPTISSEVFAGLNHQITVVINNNEYCISSNEDFVKIAKELNMKIIDDKFIDDIAFELLEDSTYRLDYSFNFDNDKFQMLNSNNYQGLKISKCTIGALGNHEYLDDVYLDSNFKEASEWMFEDCISLYTVNLKDTCIKKIESHMFENCSSLKEIVIPSTVEVINDYAFENCNNLTNVHFIKNCLDKNCSYNDCSELKRKDKSCDIYKDGILNIPCNIKYIGDYAFHNCYNITKIIFNSTDTKYSPLAFKGCPGEKNIEVVNREFDIFKFLE